MPKFKIYAGLSGGFGGANYIGTYEYNSEQEANEDAYRIAIEEYESYGGHHGLMNWNECRQDLIDSFGEEPTDEEVDSHYQEYMESCIEYWVKPYKEEE